MSCMAPPMSPVAVQLLNDAPVVLVVVVVLVTTVAPVGILVWAFASLRGGPRRGVGAGLALLALLAAYFNPVTQEIVNRAYLEGRLARVQALEGQRAERLYSELGQPDAVQEGYVFYRGAPWAPFGFSRLVVPLMGEDKTVGGIFAHFDD